MLESKFYALRINIRVFNSLHFIIIQQVLDERCNAEKDLWPKKKARNLKKRMLMVDN